MKKLWLILLFSLCLPITVTAEDTLVTYWDTFFMEDFEENLMGWPIGAVQEGSMQAERQFSEGEYVWKVTSPQANYSLIGFLPDYPIGPRRFRFQTNLRLPDFEPYACAGIMFEGNEQNGAGSFDAFLICNNKNYSLVRSENGVLKDLIKPTPISDYDSFSDFNMAVELNDGWANLLFNDTPIDTFQTGFEGGNVGLIVMPQSTAETEIRFGSFDLYYTNDPLPESMNMSYIDANAGDEMLRTLKMLGVKERISTSGGIWGELPDDSLELASMGYFGKGEPLFFADSLFLESDIAWDSAYEHPDYANAGCGFSLRDDQNNSFIEIYAGMDGFLYANAVQNGVKKSLIKERYDSWAVQGKGKLGVALDGTKMTVLWNGSVLAESDNVPLRGGGSVAYLVHSGTNAGFGTRCVFSNGENYLFAQ